MSDQLQSSYDPYASFSTDTASPSFFYDIQGQFVNSENKELSFTPKYQGNAEFVTSSQPITQTLGTVGVYQSLSPQFQPLIGNPDINTSKLYDVTPTMFLNNESGELNPKNEYSIFNFQASITSPPQLSALDKLHLENDVEDVNAYNVSFSPQPPLDASLLSNNSNINQNYELSSAAILTMSATPPPPTTEFASPTRFSQDDLPGLHAVVGGTSNESNTSNTYYKLPQTFPQSTNSPMSQQKTHNFIPKQKISMMSSSTGPSNVPDMDMDMNMNMTVPISESEMTALPTETPAVIPDVMNMPLIPSTSSSMSMSSGTIPSILTLSSSTTPQMTNTMSPMPLTIPEQIVTMTVLAPSTVSISSPQDTISSSMSSTISVNSPATLTVSTGDLTSMTNMASTTSMTSMASMASMTSMENSTKTGPPPIPPADSWMSTLVEPLYPPQDSWISEMKAPIIG